MNLWRWLAESNGNLVACVVGDTESITHEDLISINQ